MIVFCPSCGTKFDTIPPPHDPDGVVSCPKCLSTFATSGLAAPPPPAKKKFKKKPSSGFPLGPVVAAGVLGLLGAGGYFGYQMYSSKPAGDSKPAALPRPVAKGPTAAAPAQWKEFKADDGKFSVLVPGALTRTKLPNGNIEYKIDTGELMVGVVYADLSSLAKGKMTPEKAMTAERDAMVKNGGKLVRESHADTGPHAGTELIVDLPGKGLTYFRYITADHKKRMYKLEIGGKSVPPHEKDVDRFFESFKILGSP